MTLRAAVEFWRLPSPTGFFPGSFLPTSTWEYWRLFADSLQVRNTAWSGVGGFGLRTQKNRPLCASMIARGSLPGRSHYSFFSTGFWARLIFPCRGAER